MRTRIIISMLALLLIAGCTSEKPIGGERDEHGCLGPAGYSWNEEIGVCIRKWELDESQRRAAKIAVAPLSYSVTIVQVDLLRCPGCFIVHLQRNDNQEQLRVKLLDWKITGTYKEEEVNSFEECEVDSDCYPEGFKLQKCGTFYECSNGKCYQGSITCPPAQLCVDKCGDGTCQEIVCLGTGCPCAETPESCPDDCG